MTQRYPWKDRLGEFHNAVERRLINGAAEYGDRNLDGSPGRLLAEILEELEDAAAWSFLLWRRLQILRRALERAKHCPLCGAEHAPLWPAAEKGGEL